MSLRDIVRQVAPEKLLKYYRKKRRSSRASEFKKYYCEVEKRLKGKHVLRVGIFVLEASVMKLDKLFDLMMKDARFEPIYVLCPYVPMGEDVALEKLEQLEGYIKTKKWPYINTYDKQSKSWLDVRNSLSFDIIFFTNPWEGISREEYFITNFTDTLNCYVPYSSNICFDEEFDKKLQNLVWRSFLENDLTQSIARKESSIDACNTLVTGFPSLDILLDKNYVPVNVWIHNQYIKVIWAPHHTIDNRNFIEFSSFMDVADLMLNIASKYADKIQIAFKPHPLLKSKLKLHWTEERIDNYYDTWATGKNTQLEEGSYVDLFGGSTAMIFDSVSFITEYIYTLKPSLFLYNPSIDSQLNDMGKLALDCHQKAQNIEEIEAFVIGLIQGISDSKLEQKQLHYEKYLTPPNSKSASQNIFDVLVDVM